MKRVCRIYLGTERPALDEDERESLPRATRGFGMCRATYEWAQCTRPYRHDGDHVAGTLDAVVARWREETELEYRARLAHEQKHWRRRG